MLRRNLGWARLAKTYKTLYMSLRCLISSLLSFEAAHSIYARFRRRPGGEAGYQLDQAQHGREPDGWKPESDWPRRREIRIRDAAVGAFRVLYVAKFDDAVYVLHCFQKETRKTSNADLKLATQRYRDLLTELDQ